MLAELAACNAAFNVIKSAVQNGAELTRCAKQIGTFVNGEDALRRNLHKKKNSFWHKVSAGDGDDLEEFFALEEIAQKKKELEQLMIFVGRPGLHGDWVRFQVDARKRRADEERERLAKIAQIKENILMCCLWVLGIIATSGILFVILFILRKKGVI